ncbi:MAG TPA: PASTA domain-containing protein, partial [Solirubrobacterales bacterium]|nr:PASTA domain-containing protein [Solirubrobacterales bacterium]
IPTSCGPPCTIVQTQMPGPAFAASPVTGTVIRWRMQGGSPSYPYRLRVVSRSGSTYTATGSSPSVVPLGPAAQAFPVSIPIQAGQLIGIDLQPSAPLDRREFVPGAAYAYITPPVADGVPTPGVEAPEFPYEWAINADVLPPPSIASIAPAQGILASGSTVKVKITGTNFAEVTGVTFGGVPTTYTVDSDSQITALPAAQKKPGPQAVTVTTLAGTATAPKPYRYTACVVPKLAGKKLKAAKRLIRKGECKVGFVKKRGEATAKTGRVVAQKPPAGRTVRTGSKVRVTLG